MAVENEDFYQLLEEVDENKLVYLQAYIRGTLTRKWLKDLRTEFQHLSNEIERREINIEWPLDQPCLPKIIKRRPKQIVNKKQAQEETRCVEIQTDVLTDSLVTQKQTYSPDIKGTGTSVDPVIINDTVIEHDDCHNPLDSLDNIPVKDSSHSSLDNTSEQAQKHFIENNTLSADNKYYSDNRHFSIETASDSRVTSLEESTSTNHNLSCHEETIVIEKPNDENTINNDMTSVWDAEISSFATDELKLPTDKGEMKELRKNLAMELLWIQQAIQSRKNYLKLKNQMVTNT